MEERLLGENGTHEIFLKFLPHSADEAYVRAHFEAGGPSGLGQYKLTSLKAVRLSMDKGSGECKGSGWLSVGDKAEAEWLVDEWNEHPYNHMEGKHVEISHARPTGNWIQRTKTNIECRYGKLCVRADCTFRHPDGWDAETNASRGVGAMGDANAMARIVCRNGRHCNRADCFFAHPDGRDCDPKSAKKKTVDDEEAASAIRRELRDKNQELQNKAAARRRGDLHGASDPSLPKDDNMTRDEMQPSKKRKTADDQEAARAIRRDLQEAGDAGRSAPKGKKNAKDEAVLEKDVVEDDSKQNKKKKTRSMDSLALQHEVNPDADSTPKKKKKKNKLKTHEAAHADAEDEVAQHSMERAAPAEEAETRKSATPEPPGEEGDDARATGERMKMERRRAAKAAKVKERQKKNKKNKQQG